MMSYRAKVRSHPLTNGIRGVAAVDGGTGLSCTRGFPDSDIKLEIYSSGVIIISNQYNLSLS